MLVRAQRPNVRRRSRASGTSLASSERLGAELAATLELALASPLNVRQSALRWLIRKPVSTAIMCILQDALLYISKTPTITSSRDTAL
jgi:hypothetical protein